MIFSLNMLLFIGPAILLALYAQWKLHATYAQARQVPARLTGAEAARLILDQAGLDQVGIEPVPGELTDHYDPRDQVLRLSQEVYGRRSAAAVGIAAHEAGHALQDAQNYAPLVVRNAAVPVANFGGSMSMILLLGGVAFALQPLLLAGIAAFACVVLFQLVNLPVEFDASARAKERLASLQVVDQQELSVVRKVLWAAALTYVAATLQSVLTLLWYLLHFAGGRD